MQIGFNKQSSASNSKTINLKRLTESGNLFGAAISLDGNSLAYVVREDKDSSLRLKNILTESEVVIIPPSEDNLGSPRFSPDGNFIYYTQSSGIFQIPVFGGESRQIAADTWSEFSVPRTANKSHFREEIRPRKNLLSSSLQPTEAASESLPREPTRIIT